MSELKLLDTRAGHKRPRRFENWAVPEYFQKAAIAYHPNLQSQYWWSLGNPECSVFAVALVGTPQSTTAAESTKARNR